MLILEIHWLSLNLKAKDFYLITKRILDSSKKFCNGKVVSVLEGGYDLNALSEMTQKDMLMHC